VTLCASPRILEELSEVLSYGKLQPRLDQIGLTPAELVGYVMSIVSIFEVAGGAPIVLADPDDDIFVRCAQVAEASYVVSGDHHLLDLGKYGEICIITVRDFLAIFGAGASPAPTSGC
jgi:putative PIN family toxin of toxin-antitoxin system